MFDWAQYEKDTAKYIAAGLRIGQAKMNALHDQSPWLCSEVTAGPLDPYYDDTLVQSFDDWLSAMVFGE